MTPPHAVFSAALLAAGLICFIGGMIILQTRRNTSGSIPLMIVMFALSWWDITYSLFWAGAPAPYPNFWLYITYVGVVAIPGALLAFSLQLSDLGDWLKPPFIAALCLEPLLVLVLLFTDPWHGLFFAGKQTENIGMILDAGPMYWANLGYSYLMLLVTMVILIRRFTQTQGIYRDQIGIILIGLAFPWINSIIFVSGFSPFPNADNTPFSFTFAGVAFTYSLLRYRLLDILPIARHVLIESMSDGVVVLDKHSRLVDINPAARQVLGTEGPSPLGKRVEEVFSAWSDLILTFNDIRDIRTEVPVGEPPVGYLDLKIAPLYDSRGRFLGRLVVWRDITPLKRAQADLQEQAIRDPLTGLYNRRYLSDALYRELARARREHYPISLVMMDIDHFKGLNDTFGHAMGDTILSDFAALLMKQVRVDDTVCRYGGEEFLVLLPNVSAQTALEVAERWRTLFQEAHSRLAGKGPGVTVSCGIAEFPSSGNTHEQLITAADKSLYKAKALGRNRVALWQEENC